MEHVGSYDFMPGPCHRWTSRGRMIASWRGCAVCDLIWEGPAMTAALTAW